MRPNGILLVALTFAATPCAYAQALANTCHVSSSFDLTIAPDALLFDRAGPAPRRIRLQAGRLDVDGAVVRLNTEDHDRLALFEEQVRALVPRARVVADNGVDLAIKAVRAEVASLGASADTQANLDSKLATRAVELKQHIATSTSTRDWQGNAFDQYADDIVADIAPLLATDLAQQAVSAALNGDLDAAASLRDSAADLTGDLRPRLERRTQALRPQIQALCPSIKRLYELQRGVRDANARPLELLDIEKK
jgi:hypothetical protein